MEPARTDVFPTARSAVGLVMTLVSIGEMLVAVALLVFPREVALLLMDAALDTRGLILARMTGVAVLALGITWWLVRIDADRLSRHAPGFLVYNIGVGALFGVAALGASNPVIPWSVCVVHLASGATFSGLMWCRRS